MDLLSRLLGRENVIQDSSELIDLTNILGREHSPSNPLTLDKATFSDLNFTTWLHPLLPIWYGHKPSHLTERLKSKLAVVPTSLEEIMERQSFVQELYQNNEFFTAVSQARNRVDDALSHVNSITGNLMGEESTPYCKFSSYVDFLGFVLNMRAAGSIMDSSIVPMREAGELIDDCTVPLAENVVGLFLSLGRILSRTHFEITHKGRVYGKGEEWVAEWRERFQESVRFADMLEQITSEYLEELGIDQKKLSSLYRNLRENKDRPIALTNDENLAHVEGNTYYENDVYNELNERLEAVFPVLRTIGSYFETGIPKYASNLWADLEFFTVLTAKMKQFEEESEFPVTFPTILPKEDRKAVIKNGAELYVASTQPTVLNDVSHNPETHCFFITGPNGSAKTTYCRQIGQSYVMTMHGFPIIGDTAEISIIDGIYTVFDKADSPAERAGTFETQLKRLDAILSNASPHSLILLDEVDMGTDHDEAKEVIRVILDTLAERGTIAYLTSHMHEIADEVAKGRFPETMNLASELVQQDGKPVATHRVVRDRSEGSYGYLIREKVGFNRDKYRKISRSMLQ